MIEEERGLEEQADKLVAQGYMVLGQSSKSVPPVGTTGRHEWKNDYVQAAWVDEPQFLAIRMSEDTFALDVDTDPKSGHSTRAMENLEELWADFLDEFAIDPVRTGANLGNGAGIYHFQMDGITEQDVALINVENLDVIRKGHRFAVVRGTHPTTGKDYRGNLPCIDELPEFTPEMLAWWLERSAPKTYREPGAVVVQDMPALVPLGDSERRMLDLIDCKALGERDWAITGGRKRLLFGMTQRAAWRLSGSATERMGKALAYIEPWVQEAYEHADRSKAKRYASVEHFWRDNPGLSECVEQLGKELGEGDTVTPADQSDLRGIADEMLDFHKRYIYHQDEQWHRIIVLWSMHTHAMDSWRRTPRLYITAPEKNCGKSVQAELIEFFSLNGLKTESITPAALFRYVEKNRPTLVIDEVDTLWSNQNPNNEDMRAMINAGHAMDGCVIRCKPKTFEPETFSVYAPVALVGINNQRMPDTIVSRSITVVMTRNNGKASVEQFDKFDHADLQQRMEATLSGLGGLLGRNPQPVAAQRLRDRSRDVWAPLYAIAEVLGAEWTEAVDWAAGAQPEEAESYQTIILRLAREYFAQNGATTVRSAALYTYVMEESDLGQLSQKGMTSVLKGYGIEPHRKREGSVFHLEDFQPAFQTFLGVADSVADVADSVADSQTCHTKTPGNSGLVADVADVADSNGTNPWQGDSSCTNPSPDFYSKKVTDLEHEGLDVLESATSATCATDEDDVWV